MKRIIFTLGYYYESMIMLWWDGRHWAQDNFKRRSK